MVQGTLPPGLSLDAGTGAITGTPTTVGASSFTVQATDAYSNTASAVLSITVCGDLTVTTTSLPNGTVGAPYSTMLTACGGYPHNWSWSLSPLTSLPAGLSLNDNGIIAGIPITTGTSSFEVVVNDGLAGVVIQDLEITIASFGTAVGTLLWSSPNPSSAGDSVTFTAEIMGAGGPTPSGPIIFQDGGVPIGSANLVPTTNTNFLPFSSFGCVEGWGTDYSSDTLITPNYTTSPLGDQTACRFQAFDGYNAWFGGADARGLGGAQPATFSIWLQSNAEDIQNIPVSLVDLDTYVRTKQFCLVTTAWQRCSVTTPTNSSNVSPSIGDLYQTDWPWDISIWGAQVEASSSPGAYVSTADRPATATVGIATLTTAALFNGSHSLAASYSGDSNYNPSSSTALTHKVDQVKITNVYPLVNAQIGTPYSALLNAIGGSSPYSWTVALGGLPDGLLLGNDGTISGTPTGGPGGIFVARVTDSSDPDDTVTKMFEIDIASAPACLGHPIRRGDPCGNPPGISSVYPDEASAGATGQSVTVYGCYNTDENDSVGTLTINLPSAFTDATDPITTAVSVQELVNIASDAQLGTNQMSVHQSLDGCEWNTNQLPYYVTSSKPVIATIDPPLAMIGSNNTLLTIQGTNFGTAPSVNLPSGFTWLGQGSTPSTIVVTVNITYQAVIGANNITVTSNGQESDPAAFTVNGPIKMIVQPGTDIIGPTTDNPNAQSRFVTYQVQNVDSTPAASIPIAEDISFSGYNCDQPDPGHDTTHCDGTHHTGSDGMLTDEWGMYTGYTRAGCGVSITDHWQWCGPDSPAPNPGITFGTVRGWVHTADVRINGYTNPPTPMPHNFVIQP